MTQIQINITLDSNEPLTEEQVKRLIETVLPTNVGIEVENDDGGFDYVYLDSVTFEQVEGTD